MNMKYSLDINQKSKFVCTLSSLVLSSSIILFGILFIQSVSLAQESDILPPGAGDSMVDNEPHLSMLDLVRAASPMVKFVLLVLVLMSVVTWGIIISKWSQLRKAKTDTAQFSDVFWKGRNLSQIHEASVRLSGSPVAQVYAAGHRELATIVRGSESKDSNNMENIERALRKAKAEELTKLEFGTTFLATTASAAPFIGLFGTVWGIMNAFLGLSHVKSSSIQAVAPGISEALIATAIGLGAAIPAAIAYNYFMQQVRVLSRSMEVFSAEFLNIAKRDFF